MNAGRSKGGAARAAALSPEDRSAIARSGAAKRWGSKAIHKGNFKENFGIDVECYVLSDAAKTAVISQTGLARTLGFSSRSNALPDFLANKAMSETGGGELKDRLLNPLKFQWSADDGGNLVNTIHGFDVTLLIDICNAIIDAETAGRLIPSRHSNIARQAHIIVGASAKAGIKHLVYALAGYNPSTEEVIAAFKIYIQEEAKKYEQEFPSELYMQWHRLYSIPVFGGRGKPWQFKHLTVRHIYFPVAKSNGKVYQLIKALKAAGGDRRTKLFQFLNDLGARALRIHIGRVLEMAESSDNADEYERKVQVRFGDQRELELVMPTTSPTALQPPPSQSPPAAPAS